VKGVRSQPEEEKEERSYQFWPNWLRTVAVVSLVPVDARDTDHQLVIIFKQEGSWSYTNKHSKSGELKRKKMVGDGDGCVGRYR